jgi:hypothetical protein
MKQKKPRVCAGRVVRWTRKIGGSVALPDASIRYWLPYLLNTVPARGIQGLVLTSEHDREHARRFLWVGRVFRPELTAQVVVDPMKRDGTESMPSLTITSSVINTGAPQMTTTIDTREENENLLFWEAAEGGIGVWERLIAEPREFRKLAVRALELLHFRSVEWSGSTRLGKAVYSSLLRLSFELYEPTGSSVSGST